MFSACVLWTHAALGQSDPVAAEALFQEGRALLDQGKVAQACPKLAESHRLDPATGTLIALALCREAEGKLASAWAAFADAEGRARTEGSKDREAVAHERAAALYPRLSSLTIEVLPAAAEIPGLEIKRDGVVLGRSAWGTKVPIDGGEHVIEAAAPGKQPWSGTITVEVESHQVRVAVPPLLDATPAATVAEPAGPPPLEPPPPARTSAAARPGVESTKPWGGLEWAGLGAVAAGGAALAVGGYFLSDALDKKEKADPNCGADNACNADGLEQLDQAVDSGNKATLWSIVGGVLVVGGGTLFLAGRAKTAEASNSTRAGVFVDFGPRSATLRLQRRF